jgi:Protein of unknown function (DUF2924)
MADSTLTIAESTVAPMAVADPLSAELERLATLDLGQLRVQYRNHTGRIAPARISRSLLVRALAYQLQVDAYGDLSRETRRLLDRLSATSGPADAAATAASVAPSSRLKPGTLLTREWHGRLEHVMVTADGFTWNGASYASLSATAFAITGTKWNGYRFFGLASPGAAQATRKARRSNQPEPPRRQPDPPQTALAEDQR